MAKPYGFDNKFSFRVGNSNLECPHVVTSSFPPYVFCLTSTSQPLVI
jgi:hypothetical protein